MCYTSARSLQDKMAELKPMTDIEDLDVIAVSETWLKSKVYDSEIQSVGFLPCRIDRLNGRGDGVILHTKSTLTT